MNLSVPPPPARGQKTGEGPRDAGTRESCLGKKNHIGEEEAVTLKGRKADRLF